MVWSTDHSKLEVTTISVVGDLLLEQEATQCLLDDTRGNEDRTFEDGLISSSEYDDSILIDLAIIFSSLRNDGSGTDRRDIQRAISFLDFAETLKLEVRRSGSHKDQNPGSDRQVTEE